MAYYYKNQYTNNVSEAVEELDLSKNPGFVQITKAEYTARITIEQNKVSLSETDYQAIKYAEGQISEEEYAPIKAQRQAWRDEINQLEQEL